MAKLAAPCPGPIWLGDQFILHCKGCGLRDVDDEWDNEAHDHSEYECFNNSDNTCVWLAHRGRPCREKPVLSIVVEVKCRDFGRPGCLGDPDDRFTMHFDDIGQPPLYWCAWCGPQTEMVNKALEAAFKKRGLEFRTEVEAALNKAEHKLRN